MLYLHLFNKDLFCGKIDKFFNYTDQIDKLFNYTQILHNKNQLVPNVITAAGNLAEKHQINNLV